MVDAGPVWPLPHLLLKKCLLCIKYCIKRFSERGWAEGRSRSIVLACPLRSQAPDQRTAGPTAGHRAAAVTAERSEATLAKLLAGLYTPTEGTVTWDGT